MPPEKRLPAIRIPDGGGGGGPGIGVGAIIARIGVLIGGILYPREIAPGTLGEDEVAEAIRRFQEANRELPDIEPVQLPQGIERKGVPSRLPEQAMRQLQEIGVITRPLLPMPAPSTPQAKSATPQTSQRAPAVPSAPGRGGLPWWLTAILSAGVASQIRPGSITNVLTGLGTPQLPLPTPGPTPGPSPSPTPSPSPQPSPSPGGSFGARPPSVASNLCRELDQRRSQKRKRRRKCKEMANVVWSGGPKKGQLAGRKCFTYTEIQ